MAQAVARGAATALYQAIDLGDSYEDVLDAYWAAVADPKNGGPEAFHLNCDSLDSWRVYVGDFGSRGFTVNLEFTDRQVSSAHLEQGYDTLIEEKGMGLAPQGG